LLKNKSKTKKLKISIISQKVQSKAGNSLFNDAGLANWRQLKKIIIVYK
jgi:hypothetical protein